MQGLPLAIGLSLVGSFAGLLIAAALLLFPAETRGRLVPWLVSYAVGTLLGSSLLHLVPEALEQVPARQGVFALLAGILSFFVLEKLVIWRHCHEGDDECATHSRAASLVIIGDAFHTFIDGAIIGAAVLTSAPLGLSTALAAATHEIPQELGDFGVLLHAGYSPRRALLLNVASGATGIIGAVVVYTAASHAAGRAALHARVRRRRLPLRRDGRPDPRPAQPPPGPAPRPPDAAHRRRHRDDAPRLVRRRRPSPAAVHARGHPIARFGGSDRNPTSRRTTPRGTSFDQRERQNGAGGKRPTTAPLMAVR